ncbi:peroxisomal leader peptide-processing protease [Belonocnema kinseyi]|uniref:peroxisomal leader peptide-processing protease n=1 Tax=Belonocnema kinseyi TaxID=2817044 RepID=UPI00143D07F9|nr:peroxisomal leader peptide-processing protease [Belonocnema kinseyi]XP_033221374.1 peroxisomal leader peptide-processing protease [Belonocnema kinseyi]XP_033221375.1 peroxisomal leader peptide-processing protease [Belonocnema kinseyi]XP_033221376.1 peroxisomal leader peptide-processing protease [Belonocnema kinseyi]
MKKMTQPISVLVSYPSSFGGGPRETYGNSGILISEHWVLTHGSLINPMMLRDLRIRKIFQNLRIDEFFNIQEEIRRDMKFRVMWESSKGVNRKRHMEEKEGVTVFAWKCSLLKETFDSLFASWSFDKVANTDRCLLPVFLMISLKSGQSGNSISAAREALDSFVQQDLAYPMRGSITEVESTPFGNPVFIDSVARGVVSNVVGFQRCVILTDANSVPGCEGGPVYIIDERGQRRICGMVIAPLSWCRGEWVDYTFVANLNSCLQQVLSRMQCCRSLKTQPLTKEKFGTENSKLADLLDKSVVTVKCGSSWGTGILVDVKSGTVLTCSHVVREAPDSGIKVMLRRDDENKSISPTWARLVYRTPDDKPYDVAVLRVNPKEVDPSLRAIVIQGVSAHRGEAVATAGFPFFSSSLPTISRGNVSRSLACMLQTTCCVQSGTSGGPVVRWSTGEMLGMVVCNAVSSSDSALYPRLNMAIPASVLKGPLEEYLRTNDAKVLEALASQDAIVHQTWDLYLTPRSKM